MTHKNLYQAQNTSFIISGCFPKSWPLFFSENPSGSYELRKRGKQPVSRGGSSRQGTKRAAGRTQDLPRGNMTIGTPARSESSSSSDDSEEDDETYKMSPRGLKRRAERSSSSSGGHGVGSGSGAPVLVMALRKKKRKRKSRAMSLPLCLGL